METNFPFILVSRSNFSENSRRDKFWIAHVGELSQGVCEMMFSVSIKIKLTPSQCERRAKGKPKIKKKPKICCNS